MDKCWAGIAPLAPCLAVMLMGCSLGENIDRYGEGAPDAEPADVVDAADAATLPDAPVADATGDVADAHETGEGDSSLPPGDGGCEYGSSQACYSGPTGTAGKGVCKTGEQTCSSQGWSDCTGEVIPAAEVCDGEDNDCNGQTDEVCTCTPDEEQDCTAGLGACEAGVQSCSAQGTWGPCESTVTPQIEACDGIDNNCNGETDESLQRNCYPGVAGTEGVGACKHGVELCQGGTWDVCTGAVTPSSEVCDGVDNDCNLQVDDGVADEECYTGSTGTEDVGACHGGLRSCSGGSWGACAGEVIPSAEVCNGIDDDCNGAVDDEPPTIHFGGLCGEQCLDTLLDADCDGLVGEGAQDKWPLACNPLLYADEFPAAPDPLDWSASAGMTWACGQVTLPASGTLQLLQPPAQLGIQYLAETLVTLGPPPASGEWLVAVTTAFAPNNERRCRIWNHSVTGNKPTVAVEVNYGGSTYGQFIGNFALDTPAGARFLLQSYGTVNRHYCRVVSPNGEALLGEISTLPLSLSLSNTEGTARLVTQNRSATFDYLRIFGFTP